MTKATKQHQWSIVIHMMIHYIPCKQTLVCHVAVESNLYFSCASVLPHCIDTVMTRVVCRPFRLIKFFLPWLLAHLVWYQDHPIVALSTSVMYANTCSEWINAMGTIINAQIVYSKCMPSVITAPLCTKFLIDLAAPWCVCPPFHSPILVIIVFLILQQSTMRVPYFRVTMICMTMMKVQLAISMTMTAIVCVIKVNAMSNSPFSTVLVPMEIQRSSSMDWAEWM